jgi:hypothetical protein
LAKIVTTGLSAKLLPALPPPQPSKLKKKLPRRTRTLPSITNGEDVLYIIGGPPRCGKTTLSVALARKLQIPYFSIDHIASVIPPYIPAERQDESFPLKALRQQVNNHPTPVQQTALCKYKGSGAHTCEAPYVRRCTLD